jgi:hypothetical protein
MDAVVVAVAGVDVDVAVEMDVAMSRGNCLRGS